MNNLVVVDNNRVITTSRQVAKFFGKEHKHILEAIKKLLEDKEILSAEFSTHLYNDMQGKERPEYLMTKKGFTILAFGFNGKKALDFKLQYIEQFEAMEEVIKAQTALLESLEIRKLQAKVDFLLSSPSSSKTVRNLEEEKTERNYIHGFIKHFSKEYGVDERQARNNIYNAMKSSGMDVYAMTTKLSASSYIDAVQEMGWLSDLKGAAFDYFQILALRKMGKE